MPTRTRRTDNAPPTPGYDQAGSNRRRAMVIDQEPHRLARDALYIAQMNARALRDSAVALRDEWIASLPPSAFPRLPHYVHADLTLVDVAKTAVKAATAAGKPVTPAQCRTFLAIAAIFDDLDGEYGYTSKLGACMGGTDGGWSALLADAFGADASRPFPDPAKVQDAPDTQPIARVA